MKEGNIAPERTNPSEVGFVFLVEFLELPLYLFNELLLSDTERPFFMVKYLFVFTLGRAFCGLYQTYQMKPINS